MGSLLSATIATSSTPSPSKSAVIKGVGYPFGSVKVEPNCCFTTAARSAVPAGDGTEGVCDWPIDKVAAKTREMDANTLLKEAMKQSLARLQGDFFRN